MIDPWILGTRRRDIAWLHAPGLVALGLLPWLPSEKSAYLLVAFFVLSLVDAGHVYSTLLRTHVQPSRIAQLPMRLRRIYWLTPAAVASIAFVWAFAGWPHLWTVVLYATGYHHVRQYYGILRWYEKRNQRVDRPSHFYLYALIIAPIVLLHGRATALTGIFSTRDVPTLELPWLLPVGIPLFGGLVSFWLLHELRLLREGKRELNRFLAIAVPSLVTAVCLLGGQTPAQLLFPLLLAHGIGYFALLGYSMQRLERGRWFRSFAGALAVVIAFGATLGALQHLYSAAWLVWRYEEKAFEWLPAAVIALYVTPLLSHYVLDAFIWRGDHPEFRRLATPAGVTRARESTG